MRVLMVSAHFPPDFVSGGTLVPQRIAQGLAARGHDVSVYAGSLRADRAPLSTWTEHDETGMAVRWIAVAPFVDFRNAHNHRNPAVTADFTAHLAAVRPDVVHLHSVQALGAGMVTAARASGARVVVTMHDFWWTCGRQFLATAAAEPCCLVVDAGICPCAIDHRWLVRRNAHLAAELAHAHALLAPSRAAADVCRANGLGDVQVDENGLPPFSPAPRIIRPDDRVRLLFTGGRDPMKGMPVLVDALAALPTVGWELTTYGVPHSAFSVLPPSLVANITVRPAYAPDALAQVLSDRDVLLLPSVMRESFSVVTREALQAGLAVFATDTLGPEEVIVDGVNGAVLPAGDAPALAGALRALIADPQTLLTRVAAAAEPLVRTVTDQVAGLEARYQALLDAPPGAPGDNGVAAPTQRGSQRWPRRVLFIVGISGAALRYRAQLPAEALGLHGIASDVLTFNDARVPAAAMAADAVIAYRVPATDQVLEVLASVRARPEGVPVIFDVDDLIFDPGLRGSLPALEGLDPAAAELWWEGVRRYRTTMERADLFVTSTPALAAQAATLTAMPTAVVPNGLGLVMGQLADAALGRARSPGPLRIGYFSGTDTHDHDWATVEPAVIAVLLAHPEVELWLGGTLQTTAALDVVAGQVRRLPTMPWTELVGTLRDVDINLAPLALGGIFNECKSAIKWLEAAIVATPTVASPSAPFRAAIDADVTGVLALDVPAWQAGLERLIADPGLRAAIGARARRAALLGYAPALQADRYLEALGAARQHVADHGHRMPTPEWIDESHASMWRPMRTEPYPPTPGRPRDLSAPSWLASDRLLQLRTVLREGGIRAVGRGVRRRLTRGR